MIIKLYRIVMGIVRTALGRLNAMVYQGLTAVLNLLELIDYQFLAKKNFISHLPQFISSSLCNKGI